MNKDEILKALQDERRELLQTIAELTAEEMHSPGVAGEWSVKDILFHISTWEAELVKLLFQAEQGQTPISYLAKASDIDGVNAAWYIQGKERPLEQVLDDFESVRRQTIRRVQSFTDEDLNSTQRFPWLKNRLLGRLIAEVSFEHDAEHTDQIRRWRASTGE
jgi:uncharacterized damage-inducible protein DinB